MKVTPGQNKFESLGERISRLSSGDPCPCCGSRLVVGWVSALANVPAGVKDVADDLICPVCGCEVDGAQSPSAANERHPLSAAA